MKKIVCFFLLVLCAASSHAASLFSSDNPQVAAIPRSGSTAVTKLGKENVQVEQYGNQLRIVLGVDNFFRFPTSTRLLDGRNATLAQVAQLVRGYGNRLVTVTGHTDNVGPDAVKLKRSYDQANTIAAYLWSQGIPLRNIMVVGCGDTQPVSSNRTVEGAADDRRIEIVVDG